MSDWQRGEKIAAVTLLITIVSCLAALAVVPEIRRILGLEGHSPLPEPSQSGLGSNTSEPPLSTESTAPEPPPMTQSEAAVVPFTLQRRIAVPAYLLEAITFSPDGRTLITGGTSNDIKFWDIQSGTLQHSLQGPSREGSSLAFLPHSTVLLVGGDSGLGFWDTQTEKFVRVLKGSRYGLVSIDFYPNEEEVVTASGFHDKTAKIRDFKTWNVRRELVGHAEGISCVRVSADGKLIATGSWDKTVKLWDALDGTLKFTLTGSSDAILSVAFSLDSKMVAAAGDEVVRLWATQSGTLVRELRGHAKSIGSVVFSSSGKEIISASYDGTIKIWNAQTGDLIATLAQQESQERWLADFPELILSPDGKILAAIYSYLKDGQYYNSVN